MDEKFNEYLRARHAERKAEAFSLLGNRCASCGTEADLTIDHVNPATKTMNPGRAYSRGYAKFRAEIALCQLLCQRCHDAKSRDERSVDHGGGLSGKKNCKCDLCRNRKNEYMRNYKRKKRISS